MVLICMAGDVTAGLKQLHLDLKGGIGELAEDLRLCDDFGGH